MEAFGSKELICDVLDKNMCIGCGACVSLCPYFKSYNGRTSMLFPCTRPQGRCFAYCPKVEVDLDAVSNRIFGNPYATSPLGSYQSILVSRAGSKTPNANFQAGGSVSALVTYALAAKKINAAVLTGAEGLLAVPRLVTDPSQVGACASSKYTTAPVVAAFNEAVDAGHADIGVVATPCQALALAQMRTNPLNKDGFIDNMGLVIGLFCTWALDYREFRNFVAERIDPSKIKKLDIPPPPAEIMELYTESGKIDIPLAEIRKRIPNSCTYCFDMTAEFADISVGVLEGRNDANTLIIRTDRGKAIVDGAAAEGYLECSALDTDKLHHLETASGNKKKRAFMKAKNEQMLNSAGDGKRAYLRVSGKTISDLLKARSE